MERALGEPALVLCSVCLDNKKHEDRWLPLRCKNDQALLVRDVCVRPRCPRLQVRGHLCVRHVLELELSWQGNYSVRTCHGCCVSTLQLYHEKRDVWFILETSEYSIHAHGVERRVKTQPSVSQTPYASTRANRKRRTGKRQRLRRGSSRLTKHHVRGEQMLAYEWSLGNLSLEKSKHLWRDNQKRVEMKKGPLVLFASSESVTEQSHEKQTSDAANARPEPQEVFCVTLGCRRYAKTGYYCRFHSSKPLVFMKPVVEIKMTGSAAILGEG
ncbi:hypothetical protein KXD40_004099 [Peronospora effusa]|uniref:Uncharacterized protein n=1 Tax=Peronospora effusa TaxID=542832 RepID=A0A425C8Q5_9STRA|nr:hypothetical protein DD237_006032 [Peronospora effusa]UIZ28157.1 hypothetical protein KXD40_004099 [Peronospora effusa]